MLDASNIHFYPRFKFQIQKIGPFSNLNGAEIAKIGLMIIFSINFESFISTRKFNDILRKMLLILSFITQKNFHSRTGLPLEKKIDEINFKAIFSVFCTL